MLKSSKIINMLIEDYSINSKKSFLILMNYRIRNYLYKKRILGIYYSG